MKWIGISGTWRLTNPRVESDVRRAVSDLFSSGNGIVTGGAVGVDHFATDEMLRLDPLARSIKIILPATLPAYIEHYKKAPLDGAISVTQANELISQLERLYKINPQAIIGEKNNPPINQQTYFARNTKVVELSDELLAFQVNKSAGTQDTINKARAKGIPVKVFEYTIK